MNLKRQRKLKTTNLGLGQILASPTHSSFLLFFFLFSWVGPPFLLPFPAQRRLAQVASLLPTFSSMCCPARAPHSVARVATTHACPPKHCSHVIAHAGTCPRPGQRAANSLSFESHRCSVTHMSHCNPVARHSNRRCRSSISTSSFPREVAPHLVLFKPSRATPPLSVASVNLR